MKTPWIHPGIARLVAQQLDTSRGSGPVPPLPRDRLWRVVRPMLAPSQDTRGSRGKDCSSPARAAMCWIRWLDAMEWPRRCGCPVPLAQLLDELEHALASQSVPAGLDDAPRMPGPANEWAARCRAIARQARKAHAHEWDLVAARLEAWAAEADRKADA